MPHIATLLLESQSPPNAPASSPPEVLAENIPLFLPSLLPPWLHSLPELKEVCELKHWLCKPQADDALSDVRCWHHVIQGLWLFKQLNVSGTGNRPNTWMLSLYLHFNNKTDQAAQKYHIAWCALSVLDPSSSWSWWLKELKPKDVSGPGRDSDDSTTSSSCYELSWIWLLQHVTHLSLCQSKMHIGEDEFNQCMHVEWAKTRAHKMRWKEELMLIQEEMWHIILFHEWTAEWWWDHASLQNHPDQAVLSGISGYANKQADILVSLAEQCAHHCLPPLKQVVSYHHGGLVMSICFQ